MEIEQKFNPKQWLREVSVAHSEMVGDIYFRKITGQEMIVLANLQVDLEKNPPTNGLTPEEYMLCYQMYLMLKGGNEDMKEMSFDEFMTMDPKVFQEIVTVLTDAADFRASGSEEPSSSTP
jgi:hypothetical protein